MRPPPPEPLPRGQGEPGRAGWGTARPARADGPGDPQLARLAADLRTRLRPICCGWSDDAFEALVDDMARRKARWAADERAD